MQAAGVKGHMGPEPAAWTNMGICLAIASRWARFSRFVWPQAETPQENDAVRKIVLALVIAAMATPALAQLSTSGGGPNLAGDGFKGFKTDREIKQEQEREAGYKSGLGKIPDAKKTGKTDPWGDVRSTSTSASGANPARASSK
jgi:hypothetical protein